MPYIGNNHIAGDHTNNFKVLDDISSYTATFDGSATSVVDTTNNTIRVVEHRFIQGQRVTYTNGGGGNIGGLTTGTAYFIIHDSASTFKLATSASNAASSTAINLSAVGSGSSHTLNAAFDGVNTKFKLTHSSGTGARLNNATQVNVAINNVLQKPNQSASYTEGFIIEDNHKIAFKTAPTSEDIFWGSIIANTLTTFDISDHKIDTFTGDGSTTEFNLSHTPANNESLMVTINGVLQHPSNASTARAYTLIANVIQFTAAPGVGDEIQVRHMGFAGATTSDVTGFYGRTGNVVLTSNDHITTGNINAGIVTATSFDGTFSSSVGGSNANFTGIVTAGVFKGGDIEGRNLKITGLSTFVGDASFTGNVSIGGTLTYEDVTNIDSVGIITAQKDIHVGAGLSVVGVSTLGTSGSVFLQHNGTTRLQTNSTGVLINGAANIFNNGSNICVGGLGINASIFHNGDENSGMDFTHDDRVRFRTGGSERLAVTNTGIHFNVTGISTFEGNIDANGDLDVDGHTNLDNVSVAGVTTFASNVSVGNSITANGLIQAKGGANNGIKVGSNLHIRDEVNVSLEHKGIGSIYLKAVNHELRTQTNERFLVAGSGVGNGVGLYHFDGSSSTEKFRVTSSGVTVYGTAVATGADINGDLDVDGHTNLDNVSIAGVTTTTDHIHIKADNKQLRIGAHNDGDMLSYHDGNKSVIVNYTGDFHIRSNNGSRSSNEGIILKPNGATEIYHSGNKKLETTSSGAVVTGNVTATQFNSVNGSNSGFFKDNQLSFSPTGHAYIDHGTTAKDIYFRLSRASALDTLMMQFDSDGEIIKFHKMISVGLQGGSDTATLGGGSGVGAQLTLKYADGNFNTRLLGNGNSYLNVVQGNLGVGIAVASKKLHVFKSNEHPVMLERGDSSNTIIELKTNGTTRGYWGCSTTANFLVYNNDTSDINLTVNQDGNVDIAGEVSTAQDYPNFRPSLDLNFAAAKKLDSRIKYTRTGFASFTNEHGLLEIVNANEPRFDHDPVTRECKGLLIEEARTNLITYSHAPGMSSPNLGGNPQINDTVEGITLPTGEKGSVRRYLANAPGGGGRWGGYSGNANVPKTGSVWVRTVSGTTSAVIDIADGGGKTVSITEEWQRVTTTHTPSNTYEFFDIYFANPTTIYYWGVQIEEGAFMTSYIPTYNAQGTRGGDNIVIDGQDFLDFYNPVESTILVDYSHFDGVTGTNLGTNARLYRVRATGGADTRIDYVTNTGYNPYIAKDGGAVASISHGQPTVFDGGLNRNAVRVKENSFAVSINGSAVSGSALDTSGAWPPDNAMDHVSIGGMGNSYLNGHVQRFTYYPIGVSNSQLVTLTS